MTAVLPRTGRHRAPEPVGEPRLLTAADIRATWAREARHAAPEEGGRHVSPLSLVQAGD